MLSTIRPLLVLALLASAAGARQTPEMPTPAKELEKLAPMVGTWQGEGTVVPMPGMPATKWRATSHARKALGGHWIEVDDAIEFVTDPAGPKMPDLAFHSFYGFDRETQRYVVHTTSNNGRLETAELVVDGNKFTQGVHGVAGGKIELEHWSTEYSADGYKFAGRKSIGGSDFFVHVEGAMKRAQGGATVKAVDAVFEMGQPVDASSMKKLARTAGKYHMAGSMTMAAGGPSMPIGAACEVEALWGDTVVTMSVRGDPSPAGDYEGWGAMAWDARDGCYRSVWVDSLGNTSESSGYWVGDQLVFQMARTEQGVPSVQRGVIELQPNGAFKKESWTSLSGASAPFVAFEATYTAAK